MKNIICFILFFDSIICFSQAPDIEWQNTIGGSGSDNLYSIALTSDNGYILGGSSGSNIFADKTEANIGWNDYWIVKLDSVGNILWQNTIGGTDFDYLKSVQQTLDGGYIIGGYSNSGISGDKTEANLGDYDIWIIKLDSAGNIVWQNTIGGTSSDKLFSDVMQTLDGGYIIGATSNSGISADKTESSMGSDDYWLIKLDSIGNIEWENTIGGDGVDILYSIKQMQDGKYMIGGTSTSDISGDKTEPDILRPDGLRSIDYWILEIDSGNIISQQVIGGNYHDYLYDTQLGDNNRHLLGGSSNSPISFNKSEDCYGSSDYWAIESDSDLNIIWQKTIGGDSYDELRSSASTFLKGYILSGFSASGISGNKTTVNVGLDDYWLVKLDSSGYIIWQLELGGSDADRAVKILQTPDGGYIVGGWSGSNNSDTKTEDAVGGEDYWVVKLASDEVCTPAIYYIDSDGDGFGNNLISQYTCFIPDGYVIDSTDCNDANNLIHPGAIEVCNEIDDDCNGVIDEGLALLTFYFDSDNDGYGNILIDTASCFTEIAGYVSDSTDCNDTNNLIHEPVLYYADVDADGFGDIENTAYLCALLPPAGFITDSTDCDDTNNLIHEPIIYYADVDGDLYGDALNTEFFCDFIIPAGYATNSLDCDDSNILINPVTNEICNNIDDNCNDEIDEGLPTQILFIDADNDNYGNALIDTITCLFDITGYVSDSIDCDDTNPGIYPGAPELLNGYDDNCNNLVDEGLVEIETLITPNAEIYPNPNNGNFEISIQNSNSDDIYIEAYNLFGEKIYSKQFLSNGELIIHLPDKFSGIANIVIKIENSLIIKLVSIIK